MDADSPAAPGRRIGWSSAPTGRSPADARQSGEQTTLWDFPPLGVFLSWALRTRLCAHENPEVSKAEGPSSGVEDSTVEEVTLAKWTRGVGKDEVGGDA